MKSAWRFLIVYRLGLLLTVTSCQSILSGSTEQEIFEEVAYEIMPSDPLLFHIHATDKSYGSVYNSEFTYEEITEKATNLLSMSKECRANKENFDPDLGSVILYLQLILERDSFVLHHYPIASDHGLHLDVLEHFSNRSIASKNEVESYLKELNIIDQRFKELIDELETRRKSGFVAPSNILRSLSLACDSIVLIPIEDNPIYHTYNQNLNSIGLMEPNKKEEYLESCKQILLESVIPAYVRLSNYLAQLEETSLNVVGVWRFPKGDEFYQHCLKWHTGLNLPIDSIYTVAKSEFRDQEESKPMEKPNPESNIGYSPPHQFRRVLPTNAHQLGFSLYTKLENGVGDEENRVATAKLVVDIGIHHKKWLQEQAVQYLISKTNLELAHAERIVDRGISNPGLIGSEKIGQLVLRKLRNENPNLSETEFRSEITKYGPLPLGVLSRLYLENNGQTEAN